MNILTTNKNNDRYFGVARVVVAFWLLGWFLKINFFSHYLFHEISAFPVVIDFFPSFFRSPISAQFFYIYPLFVLPLFFRPQLFYFRFASFVMTASSAVLLLHQDTHNDATFLTSFWVAVWLSWFVHRMTADDPMFDVHARSLSLCVVAVIFLGGFTGKLTPEYWNGEVFASIFLQQHYGLVGEWIRAHMSAEAIRFHFQWIAKMIILGEAFLVFAPFLPYRLVCVLGIPFMLGIALYTTWMIFSVLFCLIGLLIAGLFLQKDN